MACRVVSLGLLALMLGSSANAVEPVRMGCGLMTFDTVPGWGLDAAGKSQIGPTHGSVVIDSKGQVYTSSNLGIFVFTPDGTLVRRHLGGDYTSLHDMEIRNEDGRDFLYGARNAAGEGIKIDAETGGVVFKLGIPTEEECGVKITLRKGQDHTEVWRSVFGDSSAYITLSPNSPGSGTVRKAIPITWEPTNT